MAGHGHIIPNADGSRARCGGPALCLVCAVELAALNQSPPAAEPKRQHWDCIRCGWATWFPQDGENQGFVCYGCRMSPPEQPQQPPERTTCALCQLTHTKGRSVPIARLGLANSSWVCENCLAALAEWFLTAWRIQ